MENYTWENRVRLKCREYCAAVNDGSLSDLYEDDRVSYYRVTKRMRYLFKQASKKIGVGRVQEIAESIAVSELADGAFDGYF